MAKSKITLNTLEFSQKRFDAAKDLLAAVMTKVEKFNAIGEDKALKSLVSNCIFLADSLLEELGYVTEDDAPLQMSNSESAAVFDLKSMLETDEDKK